MLDLFDKFGRIAIPTPEAIAEANLTDKQSEALDRVITAVQRREDSEVHAKLCSDAVREAMRVETDCGEIFRKSVPQIDAIDAARASFASYRAS